MGWWHERGDSSRIDFMNDKPIKHLRFDKLVEYAEGQAKLSLALVKAWDGSKHTKREEKIYLRAFKEGAKCAAQDRVIEE